MQARLSVLISAAILLASCDRDATLEPPTPYLGVYGISITPPSMSLMIGATGRFNASLIGECREMCAVIWASSDTTVASIHADSGTVIARREGKTTVTARWLGATNFLAASQVTVTH